MALPKYMLRGVSGATFGKTLRDDRHDGESAAAATANSAFRPKKSRAITRGCRCVPDGVMVEDMGSANGTFVNDQRVQTGLC